MFPSRGLILDAGILQGIENERNPYTPSTNWLSDKKRSGVRVVTIREVMAECITVQQQRWTGSVSRWSHRRVLQIHSG